MSLVALFVLLFIAIFATVPIGISLGGATILTMDWFTSMDTVVSAQLGITGLDSFTLIAIPYFILAGELMSTGGISRRIVNMAHCFVKNLVGDLPLSQPLPARSSPRSAAPVLPPSPPSAA